jgi:hypothetical protein
MTFPKPIRVEHAGDYTMRTVYIDSGECYSRRDIDAWREELRKLCQYMINVALIARSGPFMDVVTDRAEAQAEFARKVQEMLA